MANVHQPPPDRNAGLPPPINPLVEQGSTSSPLPRLLGPVEAITIVVGSMIGSGIFLKAGQVAQSLGSFGAIIFVWTMVGFITLCGALSLAELAAMLPQAGGPYVYLKRAYGSRVAYLWGWSELAIVRTGTLGSLSSATVVYLRPICGALASNLPAEMDGGAVPA